MLEQEAPCSQNGLISKSQDNINRLPDPGGQYITVVLISFLTIWRHYASGPVRDIGPRTPRSQARYLRASERAGTHTDTRGMGP